MKPGKWTLSQGKVHRQLEGPDRHEHELVVEFGGRELSICVLVPAGMAPSAIADELLERATHIAEMFAGTPCRVAYDTMTPVPPPTVLARQETLRQVAG